jgi:hypothetical protein
VRKSVSPARPGPGAIGHRTAGRNDAPEADGFRAARRRGRGEWPENAEKWPTGDGAASLKTTKKD